MDERIRIPDSCRDVMVDKCKARGAQSEITKFAPAGRRTFHDSVVSHICVWSMTSGHAQCTSRSVTNQAYPHSRELLPRKRCRVTSFRFADKKELYVKSFAKTSARKGHVHCQPLLFFLKDLLDPRLFRTLGGFSSPHAVLCSTFVILRECPSCRSQ